MGEFRNWLLMKELVAPEEGDIGPEEGAKTLAAIKAAGMAAAQGNNPVAPAMKKAAIDSIAQTNSAEGMTKSAKIVDGLTPKGKMMKPKMKKK